MLVCELLSWWSEGTYNVRREERNVICNNIVISVAGISVRKSRLCARNEIRVAARGVKRFEIMTINRW